MKREFDKDDLGDDGYGVYEEREIEREVERECEIAMERAMPRWTPGHAVACLIHYGGQCGRMPGCLQDGR